MATAARMPTAARTRTWLILCLGFLSRALGQVVFYEETCDADAFNSGINTNAAQFLRKNIVRMGTCVQAPDTPSGMAEIFNCETGRGQIFLTSTLYTRSDCLETEVADEGTYFAAFGGLPGKVNRQLFSRYYDLYYSDCTIGLEQLTVGTRFQCVHNPAWLRDPTWVGAVGYDMWPDTPSVEDCPANKLPNVRAYSTECVKMGISEPDSRLYTVVDNGDDGSKPSNQSSVSQLTYPSGFCNCATQNSQNCDVNPSATKTSAIAYPSSGTSSDDAGNNGIDNKAGACGVVQLLNYSSESNELIESPGYFVTNGSLIESPWGRYSLAETEKVKPPLDVQALLITGGVVCTLCCCCLGFLAYMMNYWALKAEKYDGRETEAERATTQDRWISRDVTFIVEKPKMYTHSGSIVEDRSLPGLSTSGLGPQGSVDYDSEYSKWQESYSGAGRYTNQALRSQSVVSLSPSEGQGQTEYNLDGSAEDLYGGGGRGTGGVTRKVSFTPPGASPRKMSLGPGGVEVGLSLATDSPMHRRGSMQPTLAERRASIAAGAGAGAGVGVVGGIRKVSFAGSKVTEDAVGEVTSPDSRRGSAHPERRGSVMPQATEERADKHERKKSHAERKKSHAERKMSHAERKLSHAERRKTKKSSMMVPLESSSPGTLTAMTLGGIAEDEDEDEDEASVSPPPSRSTPAPASALGDGDAPIEDKPFFPSLRKASIQPQQGQGQGHGEGGSRRKTKQASAISARHALL